MQTTTHDTALYAALGRLFLYPDEDVVPIAHRLAVQLRTDCPQASKALAAFVSEIGFHAPEQVEALYSRAFDLSPVAIPYVGVYCFGEDDRKRARLMAGLKAIFDGAGIDLRGELPDHLGVILRHAEVFSPEDFAELAQWCLPGPLKAMRQALEKAGNPYSHAVTAVRHVFADQYPEEFKTC